MIFYAATIGAVCGVALGILLGMWAVWGCLLGAVAVCVVAGFGGAANRKRFAVAAIFLAVASLGALRTVWQGEMVDVQTATQSWAYDRQAVVEGVVQNDPAGTATSVRAIVAISSIDERPASGRVLVSLPAYTPLAYGDRVIVRGLLQAPQTFQTNTGREFDYPRYLQVQGVTSVVMRAVLRDIQPAPPSLVGELFSLRHAFERSLEGAISEPAAALLEGIELGDKNAMPKDLNQAFISSGLVHMVVLSGYNLSIVSEAVLRVLSFLPQAAALSIGGVGMVLFAIMTGGGAATVRALMMGLIAILARYFGRSADALRALAFAAAAMALWSPLSVLYDPSFILSVLATLGLILLSPTVEGWIGGFLGGLCKDPHLNPLPSNPHLASPLRGEELLGEEVNPATPAFLADLRAIAASTISVQIFVLPALLYFTGIFSFVSIPANLLALPIVPFTMLAGFITGLCGLISQSFALIPAVITTAALQWIILVATTAANLPFATFTLPAFSAWLVATAYLPLTWLSLRVFLKKE